MRRRREERIGEIAGYWLSRRPNSPAWCRTWFDARNRQTRRVSLGTDDLDQAKLMLAAWITTNAEMKDAKPTDVPLATVLARHYENHAKDLRSAEAVRYSLLRWNEFFKGELVSDVTPDRQRDFIAGMRAEGLSDGYIRRVLADGKAAINRALKEGEIASAPHIELIAEGDPRERVATIDEVALLFKHAEPDYFTTYMMLAIGTLARPEAILELTTFQIDLDARLIRLNPSGRRQTKKRRPTIPICDTLLPMLEAAPIGHLVQWTPQPPKGLEFKKAPRPRPLKSIRAAFDRTKAAAARALRQEAARAARAHRQAGERSHAWQALRSGRTKATAIMEITPYTIRHTMATELRRRGVPVWEVAGFLGHTSGYKTTERYAKFGPDHLSEAIRAIDEYFADLRVKLRGKPFGPVINPVRASCVLPGQAPRDANPLGNLVEPSGIEPLTSTMPL